MLVVEQVIGNFMEIFESFGEAGCVGDTCAGQTSINAVDRVVGSEQELLVEAEQKVLLKNKADAIGNELRGTCIFLVGMTGCGKSTVGKCLAEALGYYFFDSDKLVEQAAGGTTVAQMLQSGREEELCDAETEVLLQLSSMGRLVVATGAGAVVRPQNWGYLRHGITVWLDAPLEAIAKDQEGETHQVLDSLIPLFQEREGYYRSADATISVAALASTMGLDDISGVTPTMLAVQVLEQISTMIKSKGKQNPGV